MKRHAHGWGTITPYRGNRYRVRITIGGERVERIVPTREIATATLDALRQRRVEVEAGISQPTGTAEDVRVRDLTGEVLTSMRAGQKHVYSQTTLRTYQIELRRLAEDSIGRRRISSLRERDVEQFVARLREGGAGTSHVRHILDRLAQVIALAVERRYISRAPVAVKRPHYNRNTAVWMPTEPELARLVIAAGRAYDRRALVAILIGADAGLRVAEIAQLRVRDVDLGLGVFHVESRGEDRDRTKTADYRDVPILSKRLRTALVALAVGRGPEDHLFGVRDKEALGRITEPAWREAFGFDPRWHGLRRRFATWRALAGDPVPVIQRWLGHRNIVTTQTYIRIPAEALRVGAQRGRRLGAGSN